MSSEERPLIEEILDYAFYAPLGMAITVLEDLPGLVQRGKAKVGPQIGVARFAGKMAFRQVRKTIDDLLAPSAPSTSSPRAHDETDVLTPSEPVIIEARGHVAEPPGPELAIPAYDTLAASQIVARLSGLDGAELTAIRAHEASHRARRTILARIDQLAKADDAD